MTLFILNLPAIACCIIAGILSVNGREGWGWFLFAAILLAAGAGYDKR